MLPPHHGRIFFLGCFAATQLAFQVHQERLHVVCTNKEAHKRLTESNGTPAMERRNVVYWNPNGRSSMISCPAMDLGRMNVVLKDAFVRW